MLMAEEMNLKKFIKACKEHDGEYNKYREINEEFHECKFGNFDDYEDFITWLKRYNVKKPDITYRAKCNFEKGRYTYNSIFEISRSIGQFDYYTELGVKIKKNIKKNTTDLKNSLLF